MNAQAMTSSDGAPSARSYEDPQLDQWVRLDQSIATHRSVRIAIPVNILLSLTCMLVAWRYGQGLSGLAWLGASAAISGIRIAIYAAFWSTEEKARERHAACHRRVERQLRLAWMSTLLSGMVWALIPFLCAAYTGPQTLFYLFVECGITAGAVTHGAAYAKVPIAFITPPIVSVMACLIYVGGFDRLCMAATLALYFVALTYTAIQAEASFRRSSRLKHEAAAMTASLAQAHARSLSLADEMRFRATHDALTGLLNRDGFLQAAAGHHDRAATPACLMLVDLDGFKAINDSFGHRVGDEVLVEVGHRLRAILPGAIAIARLGGDEFAILHAAGDPAEAPSFLASRLITAIGRPYPAIGSAAHAGASIGIHLPNDSDITEALSCADQALYAAKRAGRNCHYLFDDILRSRHRIQCDIERDLSRALLDGDLDIWFQPILKDGGRTLCCFEALVRWEHPRHSWIAPPDLMATAANAGFADMLMTHILDGVCTMLERLRDRGLDHVSVAMNVSPREMSQLPVDETLLTTLRARNLPGNCIEIEITEETALDIPAVQAKIARLAENGVRITIDDFGVGYSSLASLRQMNVDRIKIDRTFISKIGVSESDQVVVKAIMNLGQSLDLDVVAEGVETAEAFDTLRALGCDRMQGYHLGRPAPMVECLVAVDGMASAKTSAAA